MRFDSDSIRTRMITDFQTLLPSSEDILFFSTNNLLFVTISEAISQLALYDEYLSREVKWDTAQNMNSLLAEAKYRGYKIKRKQGAYGEVLVSLDDLTVPDLYGTYFTTKPFFDASVAGNSEYVTGDMVVFDTNSIDGVEDYRVFVATTTVTMSADPTVNTAQWDEVSYPVHQEIRIPKWTGFTTADGITYTSFTENNIMPGEGYSTVSVVQGIYKSENRTALGVDFEEFTVSNTSFENSIYEITVNDQVYTEVYNIYEADTNELAFEINTLNDFSGVQIKFGNGSFGKKLTLNDTVVIKYLETLGSGGNILQKRAIKNIIGTFTDTTGKEFTLKPVNFSGLDGGVAQDTLEEIRNNALLTFQSQNRAVTYADYQRLLTAHAFIAQCIIWGAYEYLVDNGLPITSTDISVVDNVIRIAAFTPSGSALTNPQKEKIFDYLRDFKSPTDLLVFEDPQFIGLSFYCTAYVADRTQSLPQLKSDISAHFQNAYLLTNMTFHQSLYETVWKSNLHVAVPAIAHHTSYIRLVEITNFSTPFNRTYQLNFQDILNTSTSSLQVEMYVRYLDVEGEVVQGWTKMGHAIPNGTWVSDVAGRSGIFDSASAIDYTNGVITIVWGDGSPPIIGHGDYTKYEVKFVYSLESNDILLTQRSQILYWYENAAIDVNYTTL